MRPKEGDDEPFSKCRRRFEIGYVNELSWQGRSDRAGRGTAVVGREINENSIKACDSENVSIFGQHDITKKGVETME